MPRRPIGDTPMTPAERKRRQRTNGRATTDRVNAAIITAFKRGLADLVEHARPATLLTVYHEVVRRFPSEDAERIDAQLFGAAGARPRVPPPAAPAPQPAPPPIFAPNTGRAAPLLGNSDSRAIMARWAPAVSAAAERVQLHRPDGRICTGKAFVDELIAAGFILWGQLREDGEFVDYLVDAKGHGQELRHRDLTEYAALLLTCRMLNSSERRTKALTDVPIIPQPPFRVGRGTTGKAVAGGDGRPVAAGVAL